MDKVPHWQATTISQESDSASYTHDMDTVMKLLGKHPTIWVFGYGSLLWKPDFRYKSKRIGYIEGYERRFYQGNITFRGKPGQPGRVANLEENKESRTWGVAYEISGQEEVTQALQALYTREATSGGYVTRVTTFYPREEHSCKRTVLVDRASKSNVHINGFTEHSRGFQVDQEYLKKEVKSAIFKTSADEFFINDLTDVSANDDDVFVDNESSRENVLGSSKENNDLMRYFCGCSKTDRNINLSHENIKIVEDSYLDSLSASNSPSKSARQEAGDVKNKSSHLPVQVLLYTATSDNDLYLGPDDIASMARQIVSASGTAGSNVEYVTKIADYVRKYIPEDLDSHLFVLDAKVREEVYRQQAMDATRLQLGLADLSRDLHDVEHEIMAEPVMAS